MKVSVYLKSGQTVNFQCDSIAFQYDEKTFEYTGYEIKGIKGFNRVSFVPSQIAAYTVKD